MIYMDINVWGPLRMKLVSDRLSPVDGVAEQSFQQLVLLIPGVITCELVSCFELIL